VNEESENGLRENYRRKRVPKGLLHRVSEEVDAARQGGNEAIRVYLEKLLKNQIFQFFSQGDVISFSGNGILISYQNVLDHLLSPNNLFPECSLMDFFETLHVLQFSRTTHSKKTADSTKTFFIFINPNFSSDLPVPDDFYKLPIDITNCHLLKGTKRMTNIHHVRLFKRLLDRANSRKLQISRLQYARMRINYEFQRAASLKCPQVDVIEHNVDEPQYVKDNEIAGFYGNIELDVLKTAFGGFFPIYQKPPTTPEQPEISSPADNEEEISISNDSNVMQEVEIDVGTETTPKADQVFNVPIMNDAVQLDHEGSDSNKENKEPTRKRKRKPYTKKPAKISKRETENALTNLLKEFDNIINDISN
jgi:hypothetical protein